MTEVIAASNKILTLGLDKKTFGDLSINDNYFRFEREKKYFQELIELTRYLEDMNKYKALNDHVKELLITIKDLLLFTARLGPQEKASGYQDDLGVLERVASQLESQLTILKSEGY